ncbi:hypothetical protein [Krasilnikovia sp. MM14-A1004]|uniref:hypothetical protein n=1 Tax=Krasilnikovia sp. MM14-A1004 TaxID=3373541 RepID=UPI00399D0198
MTDDDMALCFTPPHDFAMGIRGGPILPPNIVTSEAFAAGLSAHPSRYVLFYLPHTPSGQKVAMVAALYGLLDVISVVARGSGRLAVDSGGNLHWSPELSAEERKALELSESVRSPVLVDVRTMQVLTNDPYRMPYAFRELARRRTGGGARLLSVDAVGAPEQQWDARIFHELHAGVYRSGFLDSQDEYEQAVAGVFRFLSDLDARLAEHRFLHGDALVPSDLWLYSLLVRFDQVYGPAFRLHRYRLRDYGNVFRYLRELHRIPACAFTTDFPAISAGYFLGIAALNRGIVPVGPDDLFLRE